MKKVFLPLFVLLMTVVIIISCTKTNSIPLQAVDIVPTAAVPTSTPQVFVKAPLLDDMEDNDNQNNWGGYWYTYDDLPPSNPGTSYVVPWTDAQWAAAALPAEPYFMQAPGRTGSGYAARITGYVTTSFAYGFVGMGTAFVDPKGPVDLSLCTQISFYEKGDGKQYRMKISSSSPLFISGTGDNHFGYQFVSHATWYQQNVPMTSLTQEAGWGSTVPLASAMAMATDLQFQTVGQPQASIELWVDEITLTGCGF